MKQLRVRHAHPPFHSFNPATALYYCGFVSTLFLVYNEISGFLPMKLVEEVHLISVSSQLMRVNNCHTNC